MPWSRLRRIIEHLGPDSAVVRARSGGAPGLELQLLRRIDHWSHLAVWMQTEDGSKGKNQPVMVPFAGDPKDGRRDALATDELLARRQAKRQAELSGMREGH